MIGQHDPSVQLNTCVKEGVVQLVEKVVTSRTRLHMGLVVEATGCNEVVLSIADGMRRGMRRIAQ